MYNIVSIQPEMSVGAEFLALKQVSKSVDPDSKEAQEIVRVLFDCLENGPYIGVGLAAPQVGILARIFVVKILEMRKNTFIGSDTHQQKNITEGLDWDPTPIRMAIINPELKFLSEEKEKDYEACLSIPGVRGPVPRSKTIQIVGYNENQEVVDMVLHGFVARVFQHEYDHLNGILYIERMEPMDELQPYELKRRTSPEGER